MKKILRNDPLGIIYGFGMVSEIQDSDGNWHPFEDTYETHFSPRCCEEIALTYANREVKFGDTVIRSPLQNQHSNMIIGQTDFVMPITQEIRQYIIDNPQTGVLIGTRPFPEYREDFIERTNNGDGLSFSVGAIINRKEKSK